MKRRRAQKRLVVSWMRDAFFFKCLASILFRHPHHFIGKVQDDRRMNEPRQKRAQGVSHVQPGRSCDEDPRRRRFGVARFGVKLGLRVSPANGVEVATVGSGKGWWKKTFIYVIVRSCTYKHPCPTIFSQPVRTDSPKDNR